MRGPSKDILLISYLSRQAQYTLGLLTLWGIPTKNSKYGMLVVFLAAKSLFQYQLQTRLTAANSAEQRNPAQTVYLTEPCDFITGLYLDLAEV